MNPKLKIERAKTAELLPYAHNAKIHSAKQVEEIAASIEAFGFNDPVGVWTRPDGRLEIVEGHGRIMAANLLGIDAVPIIKLDHLTDDQRRAYVHVHNQTTLSSGFDIEQLNLELDELPGYDWEDFGFDLPDHRSFDAIQDLLENEFVGNSIEHDGETFYISITFPIDRKPAIDKLLKDIGRDGIAQIIEEAAGWE